MKHLYLLFAAFLSSVSGFSQTGPIPTVGQVYNYAAGDSFEYYNISNKGGVTYLWDIIQNRNNYGNDSIVYTLKSISGDTTGSISGILNTTLPDLDSAFYELWLYSGNQLDSTAAVISLNDTIYKAWMHIDTAFYCTTFGDIVSGVISAIGQCQLGLGTTEIASCFSGPACNSCTDDSLIYYHKANGEQGGNPYDFTTGIKELSGGSTVQLFPNPASNNFQLQFTALPPDKTYLQIFDALGQAVMEREINSSSTSVNREKLSNGIYFWQIMQEEQILQRGKLILQ